MVDRPIEIAKSLVRDRARSNVSMMPEGLIDGLSQEQIADLLAFLLAASTGAARGNPVQENDGGQ
jgi:hypothetical protein